MSYMFPTETQKYIMEKIPGKWLSWKDYRAFNGTYGLFLGKFAPLISIDLRSRILIDIQECDFSKKLINTVECAGLHLEMTRSFLEMDTYLFKINKEVQNFIKYHNFQ